MELMINEKIKKLALEAEKELKTEFEKIDEVCLFNSQKVLNAFVKNRVSNPLTR